MKDLKTQLEKKGWSPDEINHALHIMQRAEAAKTRKALIHDEIAKAALLLLAALGNFIISILLMFFILTVSHYALYGLVVFFGLGFGLLMTHLIHALNHLDDHHHHLFAAAIPLMAVLNLSISTATAYGVAHNLGLAIEETSPYTIALIYAFCFMLPYLFLFLFKRKRL